MARHVRVEIENVGGIERESFELQAGKVNVLRGRNGAGKTSGIRAMMRAFGQDAVVEVRDGAKQGTIRAPGVSVLVVGHKARGVGLSEVPEVGSDAVNRLITGAYRKGEDERARARLQALLEIVELPVTREDVEILTAGVEPLYEAVERVRAAGVTPDLIKLVEFVRTEAQSQARAAESAATTARNEAMIYQRQANEFEEQRREAHATLAADATSATIAIKNQEREAASEAYTRAKVAREAGVAEVARREELRASLGPAVDLSPLLAEVAEAELQRDRAKQRAADLREALADAEHAAVLAEQEAEAVRDRLDDLQAAAVRRMDVEAKLGEAIAMPSADEVAALERAKAQAEAEVRRYTLSHQQLSNERGATACQVKAEGQEKLANRLRSASDLLTDRAAAILNGRGVKGLTLQNGRLAALQADGQALDYDTRLSTGQQVKAALTVAAPRLHGVVFLDYAFWTALDPAARAEVAGVLAELPDLIAVTEEATEGDLRIEQAEDDRHGG